MRIVLDCDPGLDDALALLYLAAQPDCELSAVGTVQGNVTAELGAANALRVLELAECPAIPVAVGAARPLAQQPRTSEVVHGPDGLGGHAGPAPQRRPSMVSAVEQLITLARAQPGQLTVVATGPLTNLALATLIEPDLTRLLARVVVAGGVLTGSGTATPAADANTAGDPEAADVVYAAGYRLTMLGLDTDGMVEPDAAWLDAVAAVPTQQAQFAASLLEHYLRAWAGSTPHAWLHSPLAAGVALDAQLANCTERAVQVELRGTHTRGRTLSDLRSYSAGSELDRRPPVAVTTHVDGATVLRQLLESLQTTSLSVTE